MEPTIISENNITNTDITKDILNKPSSTITDKQPLTNENQHIINKNNNIINNNNN